MGDDRKQELEGALLLEDDEDELEDGSERGSRRSRGRPGDGKAEEAMEFVAGVLYRMGLATRVTVREDGERIVLDVQGADAGRAIGKKGQTLDALQFLANKVVNRSPHSRRYIVVDSGDYRQRHDASLVSMARREAKRAVELGKTVTLEPMPARDRRVIHLSLAKFPGVSTKSNGEGLGRRIQIIPVKTRQGGERPRERGPRQERDRPREPDPSRRPARPAPPAAERREGSLLVEPTDDRRDD